ncbi:MAG TPA: sigma-70 family RNA polymerase sigma factor [Gemmatimonadales bacterium]
MAAAEGQDTAPPFETTLAGVLDGAYATAYRLTGNAADAEDLVQDAALLAFRGYGGFRAGSNFRAWFYRILLNRFYSDYRRRRRRGVTVDLEGLPEAHLHERAEAHGLAGGQDVVGRMVAELDATTIGEALDALPDGFREVAALYFQQDLPYQEIAEMLEIPIGTVRSRLHRARGLLQRHLWDLAVERGIVPAAGGA